MKDICYEFYIKRDREKKKQYYNFTKEQKNLILFQ